MTKEEIIALKEEKAAIIDYTNRMINMIKQNATVMLTKDDEKKQVAMLQRIQEINQLLTTPVEE